MTDEEFAEHGCEHYDDEPEPERECRCCPAPGPPRPVSTVMVVLAWAVLQHPADRATAQTLARCVLDASGQR